MSRNKKTLSQNTAPLNKNTQENLQKETLSLKSATLNENIQENLSKQDIKQDTTKLPDNVMDTLVDTFVSNAKDRTKAENAWKDVTPEQKEIPTKEEYWNIFITAWNKYSSNSPVDWSTIKWSVVIEDERFNEDMYFKLTGYTKKYVNEYVLSHTVSKKFLENVLQTSRDFTVMPTLKNHRRYKDMTEEVQELMDKYIDKKK